ncbi:MAG: hypothetical protein E7460_09620 [Ruminococcaceae bacterium]|nr:hypothetical protein [Oscillospiraceae bacterium]
MRYVKSFVGFFLVLLMLVIPASAAVPDRASIESASLTEYELLMSSFEQQKKDGKFSGEYPDWYAGAYIDDSGELVVLVTDYSKDTLALICSATRSSVNTLFAPRSLNELMYQQSLMMSKIMSFLRQKMNNSQKLDNKLIFMIDSFVGVGISQEDNLIFVELSNSSQANRDAFTKHISSYPGIEFREVETVDSLEDPVKAEPRERGIHYQGGYLGILADPASIGYRARYNGVNGLVTAGHCVTEVGQNIGIGIVRFKQFSGSLDVAFIELYQGETVSHMTADGIPMSGYIYDPPENASVYFRGAATGYMLNGTVASTMYSGIAFDSETHQPVSLSDMLRINYSNGTTVDGDSGGLVYIYYNNSYRAVGINHGLPAFLSGSVATKAANISGVAGITAY